MSDCIFCKIINGEIPSKKVLENDNGLFSKHDLIFLENSFDQKLKQQIMQ